MFVFLIFVLFINGCGQKHWTETCGNEVCEEWENDMNCYADCGYCGDNKCQLIERSCTPSKNDCPQDCEGFEINC